MQVGTGEKKEKKKGEKRGMERVEKGGSVYQWSCNQHSAELRQQALAQRPLLRARERVCSLVFLKPQAS